MLCFHSFVCRSTRRGWGYTRLEKRNTRCAICIRPAVSFLKRIRICRRQGSIQRHRVREVRVRLLWHAMMQYHTYHMYHRKAFLSFSFFFFFYFTFFRNVLFFLFFCKGTRFVSCVFIFFFFSYKSQIGFCVFA